MIIEYMLVRELGQKRTPSWVEDGGYFMNPDDNTLIGWSPDLADRDYYIPDTVLKLTRAELITRVKDINSRYPSVDIDGNNVTDTDLENMVNNWCDSRSVL